MEAKAQGMNGEIVKANPLKSWFPLIVIAAAIALAFGVFYGIFGSPDNFEGGDPIKGHPLNIWGIIFKGGFIIPIGLAVMLVTITIAIERYTTLSFLAGGKISADVFVQRIRMKLHEGDIDGAIAECDNQKGSIANVVKAGLVKYKEVDGDSKVDSDNAKAAIQQELEEATSLELPMLERNLVIIATNASIGVLVGLLGTVIGMIKAFQAMAASGAPDASELSVGISEALVNTAIGIGSSTIAIILYNYFTTRIDGLTYKMDEAGYSIVQTYEATH